MNGERGKVTPESAATEDQTRKLAGRIDIYLERLERIAGAQERQAARSLRAARWSAWAGSFAALATAILAASTILGVDGKNTAFARCRLAAHASSISESQYIPDCMIVAGYTSDTCPIGLYPMCYRGRNLLMRLRDLIE